MIYDLSSEYDVKRFKSRCEKLIAGGSPVELKERTNRTLSQNAYLHVCVRLFGMELGYTLEEAKTVLKRSCEFMVYEKNGSLFLRRTSEMTKNEVALFTEWIRNYAAQEGVYIPDAEEYKRNRVNIDKQIESHKQYL